MRRGLIVVLLCLGLLGCKKRPIGDQSTAEQAVKAFFAALNEGELPDRLDAYITDPREIQVWGFRCREQGCNKAEFSIVEHGPSNDYHVELFVDYSVSGKQGHAYVVAKHSRFVLELEGKRWMIMQIGDRLGAEGQRQPADDQARDAAAGPTAAGELHDATTATTTGDAGGATQ